MTIYHIIYFLKAIAYGFSNQFLNIIRNYLSGRKQRTKINDLVRCVPQGSALGPLFFYFSRRILPNSRGPLSELRGEMKISIGKQCISNSACEKGLVDKFEDKLSFNFQITKLYKKAEQELHALARIFSL